MAGGRGADRIRRVGAAEVLHRDRAGDRHHRADRQVDPSGGDHEAHAGGDHQQRGRGAGDVDEVADERSGVRAVGDAQVAGVLDDVDAQQADDGGDGPDVLPAQQAREHGHRSRRHDRRPRRVMSLVVTLPRAGDDVDHRGGRGVGPDLDLVDLAAVLQDDHPVAESDDLVDLRRDVHDGDAAVAEGDDRGLDLGLGADVDAAGRLVEDEHVGLGRQPAAEQHLLLVAARQVAHPGLRVRRPDAQFGDVLVDDLVLLAAGQPSHPAAPGLHREHEVLAHGEVGDRRPRRGGSRSSRRCDGRGRRPAS